ncbi:2-amino-4-hydroxy-6-hydroxymethyldihydropteridine diphosphokinase [Gracilinema caldarium]|uniref:2-amino-4-hydroxy-6-hydroxymethyldihydropteridine pyrophosphokinase n=1 Tax=Gracilinema caldarium (strain ATCC 51460 / DSM 7334 / H1) TaxID=744872 RepID=F8F3E4_GRAC1|nr:2-amino-4-hydroxy-6-hydroxymethyldihydropteridine diphosphokinase [Gracilinema caldarium]AEJ19520.1 2-amino-4-hydroxy-6-hydroxymethyldihydropteridine pyrophosphokinase [Gracilinema caldarium DSM 7334]
MTNSSNPVVLGLGSNQGESRTILQHAITDLESRIQDLRASRIYMSEPRYVLDQPQFYNCAVAGQFNGSPQELLDFIHEIEARYGRNRNMERSKGERTLDIDILLIGSLIINDGHSLIIPHPLLRERKFALLPLLELEPEARDPQSNVPYWEIYENLEAQGIYYADFDDYNHP